MSQSTAAPRATFYNCPPSYETGFLQVDDVHNLYYEISGNPNGTPVVVLHGGPGGGVSDYMRQYFDAEKYKIVMFDQRGAGKSTPAASLVNNTTWHLVEDIEKLRTHLSIDTWVVFGGSWGSTLSLCYAIKHPEAVKALILRGIFLLRYKELTWFYQEGASFLFPDAWDKFLAPIPPQERHHLMSAYYRRLTSDDPKVRLEAATAWSVWEMTTSRLYVDPEFIKRAEDDGIFAEQFARIEAHYFVHGGFFEENWIIKNVDKIRHIPTTIVQGRYDVVCPMVSAWDLHKAFPEAELHVIADAGHSGKEAGIVSELVKAGDKYATL